VPVGRRAFEIIEVLAESAGKLVTKAERTDRIWQGVTVTEDTLHIQYDGNPQWGPSRDWGDHAAIANTGSGLAHASNRWAIPEPSVPL
jgi:hypothetical protein